MANYIGYADKEGIEQVDWSAITTDLIDGIKKEDERRVKKKGEIQKASDDLITEISDHQEALGSDTTYNGYVLDAAQQAKEFALMQNRLMKKGNLKPSEVVRSTQILSDDWKNFEKISKTFQETDAAARKAQESGTLSKQGELSYANFLKEVDINNSRLVVGPKDGRLYFQSKNGKLMDMATVNNRVADLPKDFDILISDKQVTYEINQLEKRMNADKTLHLKKGSRVMCVANLDMSGDKQIVNGSQGIVENIIGGIPLVHFNNGVKKLMDYHSWMSDDIEGLGIQQIPLILAWAITIHKAQGVTLDAAIIDAGDNIFEYGQTYVALSRVKSLEGLYLHQFNHNKITTNPKVTDYYEQITNT